MTEQPTRTGNGVALKLALIAAIASIILTAAAFWLSYEHLHDVAHTHGLADAARAWAWPATVDLFIIIGEVLMLRGSLAGRIDPWAITLTAVGSSGSIALNVAGVGANAGRMDYVVAAVPPVAALLAFGALMRQIHGALEKSIEAGQIAIDAATDSATVAAPERHETAVDTAPVALPETPSERHEAAPEAPAAALPERSETAIEAAPAAPRKRPEKRSKPTDRDAAKTAIEALYGKLGRRPTEAEMVKELVRIKNRYTSTAFAKKVRAEIETDDPKLAALGTDNVRPLTG